MIYAILFKETKEMVDLKTIQKYWPRYGQSGLHGWKPPKRVYTTIGAARAGFRYIPDGMKHLVGIYEMTPGDEISPVAKEKK